MHDCVIIKRNLNWIEHDTNSMCVGSHFHEWAYIFLSVTSVRRSRFLVKYVYLEARYYIIDCCPNNFAVLYFVFTNLFTSSFLHGQNNFSPCSTLPTQFHPIPPILQSTTFCRQPLFTYPYSQPLSSSLYSQHMTSPTPLHLTHSSRVSSFPASALDPTLPFLTPSTPRRGEVGLAPSVCHGVKWEAIFTIWELSL